MLTLPSWWEALGAETGAEVSVLSLRKVVALSLAVEADCEDVSMKVAYVS